MGPDTFVIGRVPPENELIYLVRPSSVHRCIFWGWSNGNNNTVSRLGGEQRHNNSRMRTPWETPLKTDVAEQRGAPGGVRTSRNRNWRWIICCWCWCWRAQAHRWRGTADCTVAIGRDTGHVVVAVGEGMDTITSAAPCQVSADEAADLQPGVVQQRSMQQPTMLSDAGL